MIIKGKMVSPNLGSENWFADVDAVDWHAEPDPKHKAWELLYIARLSGIGQSEAYQYLKRKVEEHGVQVPLKYMGSCAHKIYKVSSEQIAERKELPKTELPEDDPNAVNPKVPKKNKPPTTDPGV